MKEHQKIFEFELFDNRFKYENGRLKVYTDVFFDYVPVSMVKIPPDEMQLIDNIVKGNG
jgi:hypothetical protein